MKRKTSQLPTRVWKFGCHPPASNAELAREQLYAATVYQNRCIELTLQHEQEYRAARAAHWPELAALEARAAEIALQLIDADAATAAALKAERKAFAARATSLRQQAAQACETGNVELRRRTGKGGPRTVETRREAALQAMLQEPGWSAWWKAQARVQWADRERRKQARKQASGSVGAATNHRGESVVPIPHGTYDVCERAAQSAWKAHRRLLRDPTANPKSRAQAAARGRPRFRRFDGSGTLRVQLRPGDYDLASAPEPFSVSGRKLQIELSAKRPVVSDAAHVAPTPGSKRQRRLAQRPGWGVVRLRIGTDTERQPLWLELPVCIHRRLPADAQLKWAAVVVTRQGPRLHYTLQLTVESETFGKLPVGAGRAAVNFGWRSLGDGSYRLAAVLDEHGQSSHLVLPASAANPRSCGEHSIPVRLAKADDLRSISDQHFNTARATLADWLGRCSEQTSARLREATAHIAQWRAAPKLIRAAQLLIAESGVSERCHAVWTAWRQERLREQGDLFVGYEAWQDWLAAREQLSEREQLALYLYCWMRKQRHLYGWQDRQRTKAIEHRRQLVQCWAKRLADRYAELLVEDYDLREVRSACVKAADEDALSKRARKNRVRCAPGEARECLVRVAGAKVALQVTTAEPGHGASQRCSRCGRPSPVAREQLWVTCPQCGHHEDQDERNCRNRLRERFGNGAKRAPARDGGKPGLPHESGRSRAGPAPAPEPP